MQYELRASCRVLQRNLSGRSWAVKARWLLISAQQQQKQQQHLQVGTGSDPAGAGVFLLLPDRVQALVYPSVSNSQVEMLLAMQHTLSLQCYLMQSPSANQSPNRDYPSEELCCDCCVAS
jgi:hypothetical protein